MKTLDLGCGAKPRNPFNASEVFGVDLRDLGVQNVTRANLFVDPLPYSDEYFDYVSAYDFIEHLPRVLALWDPSESENKLRFPFIELMNEIYRVLVPDGLFYSKTPAFPSPEAFQDPTHVNIITEQTFPLYFNDHYPVAHIYGFRGGFKIVSQEWEKSHLVTILKKSQSPDLSRFHAY
jgi:SAM-dependent methyltransferase